MVGCCGNQNNERQKPRASDPTLCPTPGTPSMYPHPIRYMPAMKGKIMWLYFSIFSFDCDAENQNNEGQKPRASDPTLCPTPGTPSMYPHPIRYMPAMKGKIMWLYFSIFSFDCDAENQNNE